MLPRESSGRPKAWPDLVGGALAGGVGKTIIAPVERVRILFQGWSPVGGASSQAHRGEADTVACFLL